MSMDACDNAEKWLSSPYVDLTSKQIIRHYSAEQIEDCFNRDLEFGTGGLRGIIGVGTNRMNIYTVRMATQGLANYLQKSSSPKKVAIAYDSRKMSLDFARSAAEVLAYSGITSVIFPRIAPTPALSFAVRDQQCGAGICITASHNPAIYNGYKVYDSDGCQITLKAATEVQKEIGNLDIFNDVHYMDFDRALSLSLIKFIEDDVIDRYILAVKRESLRISDSFPSISVVYTPLHGTGLECVKRILSEIGIARIHTVCEQQEPDGDFPTCPYPNPEMAEALELGLRDCKIYKPDLLLATDPDCDRVGVAVKHDHDYVRLTGNEVGILLFDYICKTRAHLNLMPACPVAVTTIVSSDMADCIADRYHVELRRTLTGFKFIGEQISALEKSCEKERYIFGFEESYGYLSGSYVRDKDAVNASMLICEMVNDYKQQGLTLIDMMNRLYTTFGFYINDLKSYSFSGNDGMDKMNQLMDSLRTKPPEEIDGSSVDQIVDYQKDNTGLPQTNLLSLCLRNQCKIMIRPSGTEPKLKAYLFIKASNHHESKQLLMSISQWMNCLVAGFSVQQI